MTSTIQNGEGVEAPDLDMSWIDVAVFDREGDERVIGYSSGFKDFIDGPFLCDSVEEYHAPTEPGAYRWSGFKVRSWDEGDAMRLSGGTWTPYVLASLAREPATADVEPKTLLSWAPWDDDRIRPLLLAEASRRGAADWSYDDAENVIAFLLAVIDERALSSAAPTSEPAIAEGWPSDGTCRRCSSVPRDPTTGLCASCADEPAIAEGERDSEWKSDCWNEFFFKHLTDGNDGYLAADVIAACRAAFDAAWPDFEKADADALAALVQSSTPPASKPEITAYDAGLLNDYGGGEVDWWHDYLRAELGRAHDFYVSQWESLS